MDSGVEALAQAIRNESARLTELEERYQAMLAERRVVRKANDVPGPRGGMNRNPKPLPHSEELLKISQSMLAISGPLDGMKEAWRLVTGQEWPEE